MKTARERFDEKTKPANNGSGCILWTACTQPNGYGKFGINYRTTLAHRWNYEQAHGVVLTPDQMVLHSCDTPACVNVEHLRIGTARDNMRDMDDRGRRVAGGAKGTANVAAKLTDEIVLHCRSRYSAGRTSFSTMAREHGVSVVAMRLAVLGETWKHLPAMHSRAAISRGAS